MAPCPLEEGKGRNTVTGFPSVKVGTSGTSTLWMPVAQAPNKHAKTGGPSGAKRCGGPAVRRRQQQAIIHMHKACTSLPDTLLEGEKVRPATLSCSQCREQGLYTAQREQGTPPGHLVSIMSSTRVPCLFSSTPFEITFLYPRRYLRTQGIILTGTVSQVVIRELSDAG